MKIRVRGESIRFLDGELSKREERQADLGDPNKEREPVRDDWSASNPYPASDGEIFRMSADQYRQWLETGRKPCSSEDEQITGEQAAEKRANGEFVQENPAEHFARSSDRMRGYRGAISQDQLAGLTDTEKFAARSAHRWASHDPLGRVADRRRRRSE